MSDKLKKDSKRKVQTNGGDLQRMFESGHSQNEEAKKRKKLEELRAEASVLEKSLDKPEDVGDPAVRGQGESSAEASTEASREPVVAAAGDDDTIVVEDEPKAAPKAPYGKVKIRESESDKVEEEMSLGWSKSAHAQEEKLSDKTTTSYRIAIERERKIKTGYKVGAGKKVESDNTFQQSWKANRDWLADRKRLIPDPDSKETPRTTVSVLAMFCTLCEDRGPRFGSRHGVPGNVMNAFTEGCLSMKLTTVKSHETNKDHQARLTLSVDQHEYRVAKMNQITLHTDVLRNLFSVAFTVGKLNLSIASFSNMCYAAQLLNTKVTMPVFVKGSEGSEGIMTQTERVVFVELGKVYRSETACREMVYFLAKVLKESFEEKIEWPEPVGFAMDEATDRGKKQGLIQYLSCVHRGRVLRFYYAMLDLKSQTADVIFSTAVNSLLGLTGGDVEELHSMLFTGGTDGCSSLTGIHNGAVAQFLDRNPFSLFAHCCGHKTNLVGGGAAKEVPRVKIVDTMLIKLLKIFKASVKRREEFKSTQKDLGIGGETLLAKYIASRWLSRGDALLRLLKLLLPLYKYLKETPPKPSKAADADDDEDEDEDDEEVLPSAVLDLLSSYEVLLLLHGMCDILSKLNILSKVLQRDTVTCKEVTDHVQWFRDGLKAWEKGDADLPSTLMFHTNSLLDMVSAAGGVPTGEDDELVFDFGHDGESYSFPVTCTKPAHDRAMTALRLYASCLRRHADERFAGKESAIASLNIFEFDCMPEVDDEEFIGYGAAELKIIYGHFGKPITRKGTVFEPVITDGVFVQWDQLKRRAVAQGFSQANKGTFHNDDAYHFILTDDGCLRDCPDCVFLIKVKMNLWLQTATCERGFSARTLIKTNQRASMGNTLLDILLMLYLNGPKLSDFEAVNKLITMAIEKFMAHTNSYPA